MAGSLGRDHGDVNTRRRLDGAEADVETVREHERFAFGEMRLDLFAVEFGLFSVGRENHDDVGPRGGLRGSVYREALFFRFGARGAAFGEPNADAYAAVAKI